MKDMGWLFGLFFASLFIGIVIITVGLGALITPLYSTSAPLVCQGDFKIESQRYSYKPGQVGVQHTIYCIDKTTGEKKDISLLAIAVSGVINSGILFVILLVAALLLRLRKKSRVSSSVFRRGAPPGTAARIEDPTARLRKLKEMRDANLITQQEYDDKKKEILAKM